MEERRARLLEGLRKEIKDDRVIDAMMRVPREAFVPAPSRHLAYEDAPVGIGRGQTISQPFIVAVMISALEVRRSDKVLEIGTGSGYQAAILAELAREVITVERIESFVLSAQQRLEHLDYRNIRVLQAGEGIGWSELAPYDGIIVAAGAPTLPKGLIQQLTIGGRLVVPVGSLESQQLMKVTRTSEGYTARTLGECRFVPLIGDHAWSEEHSA
ncbi:MAG: protein-L-isoaspartate(D-aspartate) O-methyltransferase [Chloroflexi bacterium]|nr:protein-L-isoaspartate(D-aspartate) O-methyltransferase [Chloroflexota bacterium]